ncbi:MAG: dipeptidase [Clostridia bacterium]|nr:dipeptidase [Clostridia bacterium]
MWIADTHSDTLWAAGVRRMDPETLMITPEKLTQGGVGLQVFALWTGPEGNKGDVAGTITAELVALERHWLAAGFRQVDDPAEALGREKPCLMLSFEGCEAFESGLHTVREWRAKGIRMAALVWNNPNAIGFPAKGSSTDGLTAYGLSVVREMQRCGIAVDTSHLNEAGFWDILRRTDVPPLASHSCCRGLCDHFRNLTDEQLKALIRSGGYVGVNFYPWFLSKDGRADADRVAEHIDHICQLGGTENVGFGSDFDGIEVTPSDLRHAGEFPNLLDALRRRGYGEDALEKIAGDNLVRYYRRIAQF